MGQVMNLLVLIDKLVLNALKVVTIVSFVLLTILALDVTNVFAIPKRVLYSCMPAAGAIMVIYSLRNIAVELIRVGKPREGEA
jgi:TRAP-type C4-dicarboxylate transport system permease small subunit